MSDTPKTSWLQGSFQNQAKAATKELFQKSHPPVCLFSIMLLPLPYQFINKLATYGGGQEASIVRIKGWMVHQEIDTKTDPAPRRPPHLFPFPPKRTSVPPSHSLPNLISTHCPLLPWWLREAWACNAKDPGLIPQLGRSPGEGNGNPLHYSCLENSMDRGAWEATDGVAKSQTRLSDFTFLLSLSIAT